jgi:hypothetical protein
VVVSTSRTVRKGASVVAVLVLLAACGDDGGGSPDPTDGAPPATGPATLPDDVEPGQAALLLDGQLSVFTVTNCTTEPETDSATGVTTELTAAASDGVRLLDVVRSSFTADVATVTDTITLTDADGTVFESSRADVGGTQIDLRLENPLGPLLAVDPDDPGHIEADGVFGPQGGGPADPANIDGSLLLRCP